MFTNGFVRKQNNRLTDIGPPLSSRIVTWQRRGDARSYLVRIPGIVDGERGVPDKAPAVVSRSGLVVHIHLYWTCAQSRHSSEYTLSSGIRYDESSARY